MPGHARHCPTCGVRLPASRLAAEAAAVERLRAIAASRPGTSDSHATLMSGPRGPRAPQLDTATVPEEGLPAGLAEAALAATPAMGEAPDTAEEKRPAPTRPLPDGGEGARMMGLAAAQAEAPADQGEAARVRPDPSNEPTLPLRDAGMPSAGETVEGYVIEAEIGRGGMGRVYRATHEVTGQQVALKMLLPKLIDQPRQKARFVNEAKVIAKLEHANLVPLLGFLQSERRAFIVMPFVEGRTLDRLLRKEGRLPLAVAVDLFAQMCDGIAAAHELGVMHRDLKPSNVIVRPDGRVMITDFGIARAIGSEKLTLTGMVVGTAEYLSPEQASGTSRDDLRSDIYALGVLLYEMLTGQVPFRHPNAAQVLMKHVQAPPPPPRGIVPDLPEAVERALLRALAKAPDDRYPTVIAFKEAMLAAATAGSTAPPPAASPPKPSFRPLPMPVATPAPVPPSAPALAEPPPPGAAEPEAAAEASGGLAWQVAFAALLGVAIALGAWYLLEGR
ncbi:MAG: serine/threonine protein kinase [Myxococcales bacterium]|nr:serine/threonine protein kinase [Myxococcales bacterium]